MSICVKLSVEFSSLLAVRAARPAVTRNEFAACVLAEQIATPRRLRFAQRWRAITAS